MDIMKYSEKRLENIILFRPISGALSRPQLKTNFNKETFARRTTLDIDEQINNVWKEKTSKNSRLYNASKFRLSRWYLAEECWVLDVGLTDYKDLCGTNLASNRQIIQEKGLEDFGDSQSYMSMAIGVGILLMTSDDCLTVIRRASWTGEYPGMLDRPGGHPEPDQVLTPEGKPKPEIEGHLGVNDAVMDEIWNSAAQEVEDELGISKEKLQDMKFLGLTSNVSNGGRPSLEFFAKLSMKADEVQDVYSLGRQREADETTSLHFVTSTTSKLLPELILQQKDNSDGTFSARDTQSKEEAETSTSSDDLQLDHSDTLSEAKAIIAEATPYLKASLVFAGAHRLI
ncbi:uridine diphosphate glucose pyrophosphatase NUDT22-like [Palaemon carinicauda]|uniref:uridine diphosphate glucose pyrophosphatase NUDT22-like n=1 Tax=Palaemon carinicauda TaxID=392227 RepID=UPI0035B64AAA